MQNRTSHAGIPNKSSVGHLQGLLSLSKFTLLSYAYIWCLDDCLTPLLGDAIWPNRWFGRNLDDHSQQIYSWTFARPVIIIKIYTFIVCLHMVSWWLSYFTTWWCHMAKQVVWQICFAKWPRKNIVWFRRVKASKFTREEAEEILYSSTIVFSLSRKYFLFL